MPLHTSPVDGSPMRHVHRHGVEIDVCPTSGGIWLDRGELEKIVALLRKEVIAEYAPASYKKADENSNSSDEDNHHFGPGEYRRARSPGINKMEMLVDIFDF